MSDDKIQGSGSNVDPAPVHREVLPCPFCGAASVELDSEDYRWVRINCIECGSSSPSVRRFQLDLDFCKTEIELGKAGQFE